MNFDPNALLSNLMGQGGVMEQINQITALQKSATLPLSKITVHTRKGDAIAVQDGQWHAWSTMMDADNKIIPAAIVEFITGEIGVVPAASIRRSDGTNQY